MENITQQSQTKTPLEDFVGKTIKEVFVQGHEKCCKLITLTFEGGTTLQIETKLDSTQYAIAPIIRCSKGVWGIVEKPKEAE